MVICTPAKIWRKVLVECALCPHSWGRPTGRTRSCPRTTPSLWSLPSGMRFSCILSVNGLQNQHLVLKRVKVVTLCPSSLAPTSEGVIAYYWSQFDIPVDELENLPEFSEERVLDTLENGILNKRSSRGGVKITEITASSTYPWGALSQGAPARTAALAPDQTFSSRAPSVKTQMRSLSSRISVGILYAFYLHYRSSL